MRPGRSEWISRAGRYTAARLISGIGTLSVPVAIAYTLVQHLGKGAGAVGVVLCAQVAGHALFVLLGGVLADRLPPVRTMITVDVARMLIQLSIAAYLLADGDRTAVLAAFVFLHGVMTAQFGPSSSRFLKTGFPADKVRAVSAAVATGSSLATVVGPATGALLISVGGPAGAFVFDAGTFAVSAALLVSLRSGGPPTPATPGQAGARVLLREAKCGLAEVTSRRWLMAGMACITGIGIIGGGILHVALPVVAATFSDPQWAFSGWQTALGAGGLLGGVLAVRPKPTFPLRAMCPLVAVACLPYLALEAHLTFVLICAAFASTGIVQTLLNVLWQTTMTLHVPADVIGRVSSLGTLSGLIGMPVGIVLSGVTIEQAGVEPLLWLGAGGTVLLSLLLVTESARNLTSSPQGMTVPERRL